MRYVLGVGAYGQKLVRAFKIIQKRRSIWWSHIPSNGAFICERCTVYNVLGELNVATQGVQGWHRPERQQHELFIGLHSLSVAGSLHLIPDTLYGGGWVVHWWKKHHQIGLRLLKRNHPM
jgi:hypothetical protein